jgi:tetratricopeptide (TPR) repeat protein
MPGAYAEVRFEGWMPVSWSKIEHAFTQAAALDPGVASYHYHLVDLATSIHHDSTLAAERLGAMPESGWKPYFRLSVDLVFGEEAAQKRALTALDSISAPPLALLLHPSDTQLWSRVSDRLRPGHTVARGYYLTVQLPPPLRRGRIEEAARWMDRMDPESRRTIGLNAANEACFLALPLTMGASIPDTVARPLLEPGRLGQDASFRQLRCTGYYLAEQGRSRELDSLIERLQTRVAVGLNEPKEQYSSPEKVLAELEGYRAFRDDDLERAAELWQGFNTSREWGAIWRGDLYRRLGQLEKAESWYKVAWAYPLAHERLGKLYEQLDREEDALGAYKRFVEGWADASDELQDRVESVRTRIRVLKRDTTDSA